ncbi:hypothetical protein D3P96_06045 [Weissella viridescens]|uniref:SseB protein C-terminal domain-containing protein n=1 Tax=Weissella viridescens TaxID=1629 RepID=A0A3P2RE88_WEIVI|nr:hypothetical protein [Weissella viridescens]RRG17715.1 hypothetical protein D3P96_06045 [Weissella viridescens]
MNQPIMNDALIHALQANDLDLNSDKFRNVLADATLLVRGQEDDDQYQFELVAQPEIDPDRYLVDTYTNWAQLTGDESVFTMHFQDLINSIRTTDDIQGVLINQSVVLPREFFFPKGRTMLAALTEDDAEIEADLIPWLSQVANQAYLGKLIQSDDTELLMVIDADAYSDENVFIIKQYWEDYQKKHPEVPNLRVVPESSDEGQFIMENFSPVFKQTK